MITYARMIKLLRFDPESGAVFYRKNNKRAGTISKERGYRIIFLDYKLYKEHRLMWFYVHKKWPHQTDHINCKKDDNRICNLREATHTNNQCNRKVQSNNRSGFKGVGYHIRFNKWQARIGVGGKRVTLGYFISKEEAYAAYCTAAYQHHGEFARVA